MREICSIHEILQIYNLISPSISENKIDMYFQTANSACNLWKTEIGQSVHFKPLGWKACYRQGFLHTWWSENSSYLKNLPVGCSVPSIVWGWVDGAECPAHIAARSAPDPTHIAARSAPDQGWAFCIAIYRECNILHHLEISRYCNIQKISWYFNDIFSAWYWPILTIHGPSWTILSP